MRGTWQTDNHGNFGPLVLVATVVAVAMVVVPVVLALFHFLVDALTVAGVVAVAGTLIWVRVKWRQRMWVSQPQAQQAVPPFRQRRPVGQPQYQALPAPEVHNHLHLHGEDAVRAYQRTGD